MCQEQQRLTGEGCRRLDLSLRLLRNLLHIPEVRGGAPGGGASHQNQIIWNLFTQHFDRVCDIIFSNLWHNPTFDRKISCTYKGYLKSKERFYLVCNVIRHRAIDGVHCEVNKKIPSGRCK